MVGSPRRMHGSTWEGSRFGDFMHINPRAKPLVRKRRFAPCLPPSSQCPGISTTATILNNGSWVLCCLGGIKGKLGVKQGPLGPRQTKAGKGFGNLTQSSVKIQPADPN